METLADLAVAAALGDAEAAEVFVRSTQGDVYRLAAHLVDARSAEDLVQETYLRAWRNLASIRPDSNVRPWLSAIAYRACMDELRRRRRHQDRVRRLAAQPTLPFADEPHQGHLDEVVASLDAPRRAAFVLTQLLGYSYQEAAVACDVSVGTIRSRVARARAQLVASVEADAAGEM